MTPDIRTLADDELITEPGFYNISLDRHHRQPCDGVSVTSGVLRKIELATPGDVWAFHQLNPNRWESIDTAAKRMGRAMAAYVEGGEEEVKKHFLVLPDDRPQRPTRVQLTAIKEGRASKTANRSVAYWREVDTDPRDKITERQWSLIIDMGKALASDPAASAALGGVPEVTMAWQDNLTGLWCLARPDQVTFDGMLSDYKKVSPQGGRFDYRMCDRRTDQHGYFMQMAFAAEGFEALTGNWPSSVGLVFQSDERPHFTILREILEEELRIGAFVNRRSLIRFKECLESGVWPEPGDDIGAYQMNPELRERLLEEMNTEGTAP